MRFQSGFVSSRLSMLSLVVIATVFVSQWAYADEDKIGVAEAIKSAENLSGGTVISAFYKDKKDGPGIYRLMVLQDGLPHFIELAADTGKRLGSGSESKGPRKPDMNKALSAAAKQVEGEVEGIEFDPESGDYWVEMKLERGFGAIVLDGDSFKIKSMERGMFHDSKLHSVFADEDINIEFFDDKAAWMMLGDMDVKGFMDMPEIPEDVRQHIHKEFEVICEKKVLD
ncbi:hypothetical protein [Pseudoteredinibacter isoporae]|uniref:hypothetical protein n=1 Tax=Pseudoteredinibacter isoporae TaxID=570281 RepID=UPI0031084A6E